MHRTTRASSLTALLTLVLAVALGLAGCAPSSPVVPSPTTTAAPAASGASAPPGATSPVASPGTATPAPTPSELPAPTPTPLDGTLDAAGQAVLQARLDELRSASGIPAMTVAIRLPDGTIWTGASGTAIVRSKAVARPDTVFGIASITKTFVTALILQLQEEGALSIDDRLGEYLPDYPNADAITLRQLLNHTSGLYNYFENPAYNRRVFADRSRVWTFPEILGFVRRPYFPPGRGIHYSNTGFVLLGAVAEKVTGSKLSAEIRRRFLDPLDLDRTVFQYEEETPRGVAHGYLPFGDTYVDWTDGTRRVPNTSAVTVAWAAGAMASSAPDLVRWADALYGGAVLSPETTAMLSDFSIVADYGLGTRTERFLRRRAIGHTGGIRGFSTAMWHLPHEDITIVVLTNLGFVNPNRLTRDMLRTLFSLVAVPPPEGAGAPSPSPSAAP